MQLVEQHLIRKITESGAFHWRQYNLYVNTIGTTWEMKVFVGRSKNNLIEKQKNQYSFREEAALDINNLLDNYINRGFVYIDRIITNMVDTPFSKFTPLRNTTISIEKAQENGYLNDDKYRLIPVHGGVHCCIRIGYDTAFHVEAKTNSGVILPLPKSVHAQLVEMISLCEYETFVLEAFVSRKKVTLIDVICINGKYINKPLQQRFSLLSHLVGSDRVFTQLKKPSAITLGSPRCVTQENRPYWYAIKPLQANFEKESTGITFLIPQYFVFNVMASRIRDDLLAYRDKKQRVKLLVSESDNSAGLTFSDVGELILPLDHPTHEIKLIQTKGLEAGKMVSPRLCQHHYQSNFLLKSTSSQFSNLQSHWAAYL